MEIRREGKVIIVYVWHQMSVVSGLAEQRSYIYTVSRLIHRWFFPTFQLLLVHFISFEVDDLVLCLSAWCRSQAQQPLLPVGLDGPPNRH